MKLLYLYFTYRPEFKRIFADDIEFNFDSEMRFKLDGGELKRIDSVGELPKGFFSVLPQNRTSPAVDSVSVIAGGNGAGKTSIVEVLLDIKEALNAPRQSSRFKEFIVVCCRGAENECYYESNIQDLKTPDGLKKTTDEAWANNGFQDVPLVYVTPHFTPYALVDIPAYPHSFSDLSTIGLLKAVNEKVYNPHAEDMGDIQRLDPIGPYQTEQTKWTLSFVRAEQELSPKKKLPPEEKLRDEDADDHEPLFNPIGIRVSLSKVALQKLRSKNTVDGVRRILENIKPGAGFFEMVFYAYVGLYINDKTIVSSPMENEIDIKDAWNKFCEYENDLTDLFLGEFPPKKQDILRFLGSQKEYQQKDYVNAVRLFFQQLDEILRLVSSNELDNAAVTGNIMLDMRSQEVFGALLKLVDLHFKAKVIVPFLDFDTAPRMSAGERAFFDTWGRLYHHFLESVEVRTSVQEFESLDFSDHQNWPQRKDAIIFFDEAETTMHPEWQRRIVQRTIWFFEAFAPWIHPHLIFATHSPILLSDVPAGNVVLLERKDDRSEVCPLDKTKAFASNIFDLYRDSFFLKSGCTMGAFAASKVNALLEKLQPRKSKIDRRELDGILSLAKMIGDPFISRLIWRRLDALIDDDGDLRVDQFDEGAGI